MQNEGTTRRKQAEEKKKKRKKEKRKKKDGQEEETKGADETTGGKGKKMAISGRGDDRVAYLYVVGRSTGTQFVARMHLQGVIDYTGLEYGESIGIISNELPHHHYV